MTTRFYSQAGLAWAGVHDTDTRRQFGTPGSDGFKLALRRHLADTADASLMADQNRSAVFLRDVKPTTRRWKHLELGPRRVGSQLSRLRLGCSRLAADQFHRDYSDSPMCTHCADGVLESREHFLLECPAWQHQRNQLWSELAALDVRGLHLPCTASTLLGGCGTTRNRSHLEGIAAATGRFVTRTGRLCAPCQ